MSDDADDDLQAAALRALLEEREDRIELTPGQLLSFMLMSAIASFAIANPTGRQVLASTWRFMLATWGPLLPFVGGFVLLTFGLVTGFLAGEKMAQAEAERGDQA